MLVWRRTLAVVHRTLDDDEAALVPMLEARATLAEISARIAEISSIAPDQRMLELLVRWVDASVLAGTW